MPVLSVAIVVMAPIDSIEPIVRTNALRRAIRRIANTKMTDMAIGKFSGTALTLRAITKRNASLHSTPRASANQKANKAIPRITATIRVIRLSIFCCTGLTLWSPDDKSLKRPNSVSFAVAVTIAMAVPPTTNEP